MANYDYVYTLYLAAFFSAGPAITLLWKNYQRRGLTSFFLLPLIAFISIIIYMVIDLNFAWSHPRISTDSDTYRRLSTVQFVVDAISGVALGWAYVLRLRIVINTSVQFGEMPYWLGLLAWFTAVMPTIYPASDIVGIVVTWDESLATCCNGNLTTYLYGSFNVAFALNDLIMECALAYILFSRTLIDRQRKRRLIVIAMALSLDSAGLLAGAIVTFFESQLGVQIVYSFWLVNVWVFMETNRVLGKTLEGKKSTTSGSRIRSEKTSIGTPTTVDERDHV